MMCFVVISRMMTVDCVVMDWIMKVIMVMACVCEITLVVLGNERRDVVKAFSYLEASANWGVPRTSISTLSSSAG